MRIVERSRRIDARGLRGARSGGINKKKRRVRNMLVDGLRLPEKHQVNISKDKDEMRYDTEHAACT